MLGLRALTPPTSWPYSVSIITQYGVFPVREWHVLIFVASYDLHR